MLGLPIKQHENSAQQQNCVLPISKANEHHKLAWDPHSVRISSIMTTTLDSFEFTNWSCEQPKTLDGEHMVVQELGRGCSAIREDACISNDTLWSVAEHENPVWNSRDGFGRDIVTNTHVMCSLHIYTTAPCSARHLELALSTNWLLCVGLQLLWFNNMQIRPKHCAGIVSCKVGLPGG